MPIDDYRDRLIAKLLYSTGMRVGELAKLRLKELLPILLGIGLLTLVLLSGLVSKTGRGSPTDVEVEQEALLTSSKDKADHELFMCLGVDNGMPVEPRADFSTTDKIHCLIRWQGISRGNHEVEYYWINPKGKTQEYYKQDFVVSRGNRYNVWSWLRLREGEFIISTEFVGRWSVQVFFDGEFITEESFRVR